MKSHQKKIPLEFNRITQYIYIGTNACCQQHFDTALLKKGIRADISFEEKHLDSPWGVSYFLWTPTKNHTAPTVKQLQLGVSALHELVKNKIKTYVHCQRGHGRAPTLVAAYLVSQGMSAKQAINHVRAKRPSIHLERVQIDTLVRFARARR